MQTCGKCVYEWDSDRDVQRSSSRRVNRSLRHGIALASLLALAILPEGNSQSSGSGNGSYGAGTRPPIYGRSADGTVPGGEDYDSIMTERRIRALNTERQRMLVADTNKLFRLAKELNTEIASANMGTWTLDQIHKLAEIEKLAHSVKERMSTGVGEPPSMLPPPGMVYPSH